MVGIRGDAGKCRNRGFKEGIRDVRGALACASLPCVTDRSERLPEG